MKLSELLGKLSLNQKLTALLLVLAFLAIFMGDPYGKSRTAIETRELALIVQKEVDHISVEDLADWIIQGRADYRLIDLRSEEEYNTYHIPTAENVPLAELPNADLLRNEKIILYSEGGIHSAQGWFLLKAMRYRAVYMLLGGLDEWKHKILYPVIPTNLPPDEKDKYARMAEISRWFGGAPQTTEAPERAHTITNLPPPPPAAAAPSMPAKTPAKKKKEGC